MKKLLCLLCICLMGVPIALAEEVWIQEDWRQVHEEIDCDGLPLLIDGRVLPVPPGTTAREYHTSKLSNSFMAAMCENTDWSLLGCDVSQGTWREPTTAFPEYAFTSGEAIYPNFTIGRCWLHLTNFTPTYIYETNDRFTHDTGSIGFEGLEAEQFRGYAEQVAAVLGYQLGEMARIHQVNQPELLRESIAAANAKSPPQFALDADRAEEYAFVDAYYPVYFNGLRLYSGQYQSTYDLLEIPPMNLRLAVARDHGIALVESVVLDAQALKPTSEEQPVLSAEEALRCIEDYYRNMFLPGLTRVTVQQLVMEYVPMTGDVTATEGFTLYPAWVARVRWEGMEDDESVPFIIDQGFHAVTGRPLF